MGRFSPDGTRVIFQSRMRSHKSAQIYILNLTNSKERRVTYNDGDDFSPSFDGSGKYIVYASTTDEIKEHLADSHSSPIKPFNPAEVLDERAGFEELYISEADGSHIRRLTNTAGFDGQGQITKNRIVFVSSRDNVYELDTMAINGKGLTRIFRSPEAIASPVLSPDGRAIAYLARSQGQSHFQIKTTDFWGKRIVEVTDNPFLSRDPAWTPDGKKILFSSNRGKDGRFFIYQVNSDGSCLKQITQATKGSSAATADVYPTLSPDGKKLLYSSNRTGTYQIYMVDFLEPKDCPIIPATPSPTPAVTPTPNPTGSPSPTPSHS